jgi:hypothetical protein
LKVNRRFGGTLLCLPPAFTLVFALLVVHGLFLVPSKSNLGEQQMN